MSYLGLLYCFVFYSSMVSLSSYQIQAELKKGKEAKGLIELRLLWNSYNAEKERLISERLKLRSLKDSATIENKLIDNDEKQILLPGIIIQERSKKGEIDPTVSNMFYLIVDSEFGKIFGNLVFWPVEILILLLTLSMGILGSTIHINREFFKPTEYRPSWWFFFRPALGMATAFAVFILFRAGQLSITGPTTATPSDSMNAFMVSFLAVISGLLSEDAYLWIVRIGQNLFKTDSKEKRYANPHNIKERLNSKNFTVDDLAKHVGVEVSEVSSWLKIEKPVLRENQIKISGFLEKPTNELFFA